jgi:3-methyladenine DNA glycosylase AlkD
LRWAVADDVWKRRTVLLVQLKSKRSTDIGPLLYAVDVSKKEDDFFLRKGIGWALREYSKTDPQTVLDYVSANSTELSTLSKREALKILLNSGKLDQIP